MLNRHGDFNIDLRGNILFVEMSGAWNIETAIEFSDKLVEAYQPLVGSTWAVLTRMCQWELCTPDCEPIIVDFSIQAKKSGMTREAVVNSNQASQMKLELFAKFHNEALVKEANAEFERAFFDNPQSALQWLNQSGYFA